MRESSSVIDSTGILKVLAHRYPFLLVDTIDAVEPGRRVVGTRRVTRNEWFGGVMPNILVIEALAQTSAALLLDLVAGKEGVVGYFAAIERVRLREPAAAGDTLLLNVELSSFRRGVAHIAGSATVDGRRVVSASFTTIVRPAT